MKNTSQVTRQVSKTMVMLTVVLCLTAVGYGDYAIVWSTVDGGGGTSTGGQYVLTGTIGQPDAAYSASEQYELLGGFWPGGPLCVIDFGDYANLAAYWLQTGTGLPPDLYPDGVIDELDLATFVSQWLCYCPYGWPLK
jgi:hypothetical protein